MSFTVNSGRSLYDGGDPIPGVIANNDGGEHVYAGYTAGDLPFGRIVAAFTLQSDGTRKLFAEIDASTTLSDGVSVYSFDAIAAQSDCKYSENEAVGVLGQGDIVVETWEDLALDNTALTVVNGAGSGGADDVGKVAQSTGTGYSSTTNLRLVRKISSTLAVVRVTGPITLTAL